MSFQPQQGVNPLNGHYTGFQQPGYDYQNAHNLAPNHTVPANPQEQAATPPLPDQYAQYDPFAHAELAQNPPMPDETSEAPPLPIEEAPPLPTDDAPPLPPEPAEPIHGSAHTPLCAEPQDQQIQSPLCLAVQPAVPEQAQLAHQVQFQQPEAWSTYSHPGCEAYLNQQTRWQQSAYANQYTAYAQPAPAYQQHPWQSQQSQHWQQSQQHAQQQHQPAPALAHSMPPPAMPPANPHTAEQPAAKIVTDAASIFQVPGRVTRPKRLAIVLRGLPGSGKSFVAKRLKDIEVEQGGDAPRIHALDDYFYTEVEKEVMEEVPGKKPRKRSRRQMEYCYEPELEDTYKASMVQAFERTVKEARFGMVIVDAPNLSVDDLKTYWAAGQRGGYEVYIVEVSDASHEQCLQHNIHNRSADDIAEAAQRWQPTPPTYPLLDVGPLFGVSEKMTKQGGIAEVEMDEGSVSEGSEDVEEQHKAAAKAISSKWANESEEQAEKKSSSRRRALAQGQGSSKRVKPRPAPAPDNDYDGLTAGLDGFFGKTQGHRGMRDNATTTRGVLKKGGSMGDGGSRSVHWADQEPSGQSGFRIGGSQQLETIYVLEGLGPPKEHPPGSKSFRDQIKAEHSAERHAFRDILLGGRRA